MQKGENTRQLIIEKASSLFNQKGYSGTSMSDIMAETRLKKGGIYNHFATKEEIRLASFNYNYNKLKQTVNDLIKSKSNSTEKLLTMVTFYRDYPLNPVIKGGCPIINSIIDRDQTDIQLNTAVSDAIDQLLASIARIISNGKRYNEFKESIHEEDSAVQIYTMIQGGVLLTRGKNDARYMNMICDHLEQYILNLKTKLN